MNILVIHEADYINKVVFEYQIIPEILSSKGHNVFVIDFPVAWKRESLLDLGGFKTTYLRNVKKSNKSKGVTLIRPGFIKLRILDRLSAFFAYFFLIKKTIKNNKIDAIVLYSVPNNGLQTLYWAKKYKIPVHFRLIDVLHQLVPNKILSPITYLMEKKVYRETDQISAITPKLITYAKRMGCKKKIAFLPTGSDSDIFFPKKKKQDLCQKYGIKSTDKLIMFSGTLYGFSGLNHILNYFADHIRDKSNIKFMIVGKGEQLNELKNIVRTKSLSKYVIFAGFVQYEKLVDYINLADICINPFELNYITDRIFPSKIYQYLACEKPVIATKLPGMLDIFPDKGGKNNVYYFSLDNIKEFFNLVSKIDLFHKNESPSLQTVSDDLECMLNEICS